jgi:tagatose-1,6-bisphosphate aldolase non-catalytic subunit AgaZ/GatZ
LALLVLTVLVLFGCETPEKTSPPTADGAVKADKAETPSPQAPQAIPVPEDKLTDSKESPSDQLVKINLERKSAQNAKELAKIIEEVIKETENVKECYVVGAGEEVSTGGYWLSAEIKLKDAKNAWQVARDGVLAAYLNKGNVQLVKVSVNIMAPPEDRMYALQVSAGKNHFDKETLRFLKNGTWIDFQAWIEENQTKGGYKQYADDLWAQGPLAF